MSVSLKDLKNSHKGILCPSIMAIDYWNISQQIKECEAQGIEALHLDVMDQNFVPNLTFGSDLVKSIRPHTTAWLDAHLMVVDPISVARAFIQAGVDHVTFHVESVADPLETLKQIRQIALDLKRLVTVGIAINPPTPTSAIPVAMIKADSPLAIDMVLVMSVMPGFYGQSFQPVALEKIPQIRAIAGESLAIQVDGGINVSNLASARQAGADLLVVGAAAFKGNITNNLQNLRGALL